MATATMTAAPISGVMMTIAAAINLTAATGTGTADQTGPASASATMTAAPDRVAAAISDPRGPARAGETAPFLDIIEIEMIAHEPTRLVDMRLKFP